MISMELFLTLQYQQVTEQQQTLIQLSYTTIVNLPLQVRPSPEYPGLQVQLYEPLVLLHSELALQLSFPVEHSSMS